MKRKEENEEDGVVLNESVLSKLSVEAFSEYSLVVQNANLIEIGDLSQHEKLKTINLACNRISRIQGLERLEDLRSLQIYNNNLVSLKGIGRNRRLETIHVHCNSIDEIPVEISNLRILKELRMGYNKLTSLCYHLTQCRNLKHLDLCQNNINSLEGIGDLRNLEILDVSRNCLDTDSIKELKSCTKLQELRLAHNRIESASDLKPLRRLLTLDLSNNRIERMRDIPSLPNLCELYLSRNGLKDLGSRALKSRFPELDTFDLGHNCISDLNKLRNLASESNAPNLRELWIEGNDIVVEMEVKSETKSKVVCSDHISQASCILNHFPHLDALNGHSIAKDKNSKPSLPRPTSRRGVPSRNFLSREEICLRAKMMRERFHDFRNRLESLSKIANPEIPAPPPRRRVSRDLNEALMYSQKSPPRTVLADTKTTSSIRSVVRKKRHVRPLTAPANARDEDENYERIIGGYVTKDVSMNRRRPQTSRAKNKKTELRSFRVPPKVKSFINDCM